IGGRAHESERGMVRSGLRVVCVLCLAVGFAVVPAGAGEKSESVSTTLPGTELLGPHGDMAAETVAGIDRFLQRLLDRSLDGRGERWKRDFSSHEAYGASVAPQRERLARMIGLRDPRVPFEGLQFLSPSSQPAPLAQVGGAAGYQVFAVAWPALDGMRGDGLLLEPVGGKAVAGVVVIPDCAQTPEMLVGLAVGVESKSQFPRRLVENGCRVLIPVLIDRQMDLVGSTPANRPGKVTHRELLYRPAYQLGRHLLGYEVQKVLAGIDALEALAGTDQPLGVVGYGEGGLIALLSGAIDLRIDVTGVSGYFDSRQEVWREPIDRNLFGLLEEFGDAEIGSLVAPRALVVEAAAVPEVVIPPGLSSAPGRITTPPWDRVQREFQRMQALVRDLTPKPHLELISSGEGEGPFGSRQFVESLLKRLGQTAIRPPGEPPSEIDLEARIAARRVRQFREIGAFNERLIDESSDVRRAFLSKLDVTHGVAEYATSTLPYRETLRERILGDFTKERIPARPRARLAYQTDAYQGYEVVLDVFPEVILYGVLLIPRGIAEGERRPVVVCQHGLEGRAEHTIEGDKTSYRDFAARLARRGFVTFSPQHPYAGGDAFRTLQRKANPLGKSLFSVMLAQHRQLLDWLRGLPCVDRERIAFYGISYGGKSAMRIPAVLEGYSASICSSDFSDWIWRTVSQRHPFGYLAHSEYEIFEFDLGSTFNYAELAALICPRPFMVETFHQRDAFSEHVDLEFSKIASRYKSLGIEDRLALTYYPHFQTPSPYVERETFEFLQRHLRWPEPEGGR
ncbi:MAG: hypothetical protein ACKV0T_15080, partial [Planctomycetales bacterium]